MQQVLQQTSQSIPLYEIYESYDRERWENAITRYRKPSYQRTQKRSNQWCASLIDSILCGKSIGAFHFSEWTDTTGTYYNVEDGQTRLDAVMRFVEGNIESFHGTFENLSPEMRRRLDNYKICMILQRKKDNSITDQTYFKALNENFTLLNDNGRKLTSSDMFCCQFPDPSTEFSGAPLILYSIEFVNDIFQDFFETILNVQMTNRIENSRKKIDNLVAIVSGSIYGCAYAKGGYRNKVDILYEVVSDEVKQLGIRRLRTIFETFTYALAEYPRQSRERLYDLFGKPKKFIGAMLCDLEGNPNQDLQAFKEMWKWFINESRRRQNNGEVNWVENNVYRTLSAANRRNTSRIDFHRRMQCVHVFYAQTQLFPEDEQRIEGGEHAH